MNAVAMMLSVLTTYWAVMGTYTWIRRRRLHHALRVQETLDRFALARNKLVHLVMDRQLQADSVTFKKLYYLQTALMRRPDHYKTISDNLLGVLINAKEIGKPTPMALESERWTEDVRQVADATARGLMLLLVDYSVVRRAAFRTIGAISWCKDKMSILEKHIAAIEDRLKPDLRGLRAITVELSQLAAA